MGEEFYAIIKLVSGEEIFSLVSVDENDGDPVVLLQNPIIIKQISDGSGMYLKVKPWMELPDEDIFVIKLDKMLTITETKNKNLIKIYHRYINDSTDDHNQFLQMKKSTGEVKISDKMGYISSVEDARNYLENIFKSDLKDNKES